MSLTPEITQEIRKKLHEFIDTKCLFRTDPTKSYDFLTPVGKLPAPIGSQKEGLSNLFLLRRVAYDAEMNTFVSLLFVNKLAELMSEGKIPKDIQLGGMEASSIPLLIGMQKYLEYDLKIHVNIFTVRKTRKDYGLFQFVNGIVDPDKPVLFVDDLLQSGNSFRKFVSICEKELNIKVLPHLMVIHTMHKEPPFYVKYGDDDNTLYEIFTIFKLDDFDYKFNPTVLTTMAGDVNV